MSKRKSTAKASAVDLRMPLDYVPVETGWAVPADLTAKGRADPEKAAAEIAASIAVRAAAASPWNPDGIAPAGFGETDIAAAILRTFRALPKGARGRNVLLVRDAPVPTVSIEPTRLLQEEWSPAAGIGPAWRVVRQAGDPVAVALDEAGAFHLLGEGVLDDPVGFMRTRAAATPDRLYVMPASLTGHLCAFALGLMAEVEPDAVFLGHLDALWRHTTPLAARHAAFAADHAAFEEAMVSPFELTTKGIEAGDVYRAAADEATALLARIAHTPAAEAYCLHAGVGLGRVMTMERDRDRAAWTDFAQWLGELAPGRSIGPDAFRTTLMLEVEGSREAAANFEAWLPDPIAVASSDEGLRGQLFEKDGLVFMTGELHPNFEIVGWSIEVAHRAGSLH